MMRPPPTSTLFPYTTLFRSTDAVTQNKVSITAKFIAQTQDHFYGDATIELKNSGTAEDRKSTRLNSSHSSISYAVFCLKKKNNKNRKKANEKKQITATI